MARSPGPVLLKDSHQLAQRVLAKLGYLDDALNSDLKEALKVFANTSRNKRMLRKLGELPNHDDSAAEVCRHLRSALLSSRSSGQWQLPPSDIAVRKLLLRSNLVDKISASREQIMQAMRRLAAMNGLPTMKTYNGFLWQLLLTLNRNDPQRRDACDKVW